MANKLTTIEFIKRCEVKFTNYDYSLVEYVNMKTPVIINCLEHGEFKQTPLLILHHNISCPRCSGIVNSTETFIDKSKTIHNEKYLYDSVNYIKQLGKVIITCPEHGDFKQTPASHLKGHGCPKCSGNKKLTNYEFICKSEKIHNKKYNYDFVQYTNNNTNVKIICSEHGEFEQLPTHHLKGCGCPKCGQNNTILSIQKNVEQFMYEANFVHGDKYDYSKTIYTNCKDKVIITCLEHGDFKQTPDSHIQGCGCPKCGLRYDIREQELKDFITSINIPFVENDRNLIKPLELDIYIPSKNIAIEFNGLYWHSELHKPNNYHLDKTNKCEAKGVQLIHIFEDEWLHRKDVVKSRIKNLLGLTKDKIYARKCVIKEVLSKEKTKFLNNNHLQGSSNSSIKVGLYYNDELVSLMTFNKPRLGIGTKYDGYELSRFCNKIDTTVIGGASRLLKYFIKTYSPKEIKSYADRRWSDGGLYDTLGFKETHINKPNYWYIKGLNRLHRFNFRKSKLLKDGFDITNKTEREIMLDRKIYRIYDCGTITYKKTLD